MHISTHFVLRNKRNVEMTVVTYVLVRLHVILHSGALQHGDHDCRELCDNLMFLHIIDSAIHTIAERMLVLLSCMRVQRSSD